MKMVTDKLYCVDFPAEHWDCCLTCDKFCSPNLAGKGGTHILHDLVTWKCSISYLHIFKKKPKLSSNGNRFFIIFFSLGLFMVQLYGEDVLLVGKTFFCLNTFQVSENYFVRKMFDLLQLLILQVKSQYLVY